MDDMAKQINDALDHDFKDVPKMRHLNINIQPDKTTVTGMIDATIAFLEAQIKALQEVRRRL